MKGKPEVTGWVIMIGKPKASKPISVHVVYMHKSKPQHGVYNTTLERALNTTKDL